MEKSKNLQLKRFQSFASWKIPKNLQFWKFQKFQNWKIPKNFYLNFF